MMKKMKMMLITMMLIGVVQAISTSNLDPSQVDPLTSESDPNSVSHDPKYNPNDPDFDLSDSSLDLIFPELSKKLKKLEAVLDLTYYDESVTPEQNLDPGQTNPESDSSLTQEPNTVPNLSPQTTPISEQQYPKKSPPQPQPTSDVTTGIPDLGTTTGAEESHHRSKRHFSSIDICGEALCDQMVRQATGLARVKLVRRYVMESVKAMDSLLTSLDAEIIVAGETLARSLGNRCRSAHALLTHVTQGPVDTDRLNAKNSRFVYGTSPNFT